MTKTIQTNILSNSNKLLDCNNLRTADELDELPASYREEFSVDIIYF